MKKEHRVKLQNTFSGIKKRCNNKRHIYYKYYGGRGIKCSWKNFKSFCNDMYTKDFINHFETYGSRHTQIDRIDNDGGYCKENCRWVTPKKQCLNKSNSNTYNGKSFSEISTSLGGNRNMVLDRIKNGWELERAVTIPSRQPKKYLFKNEYFTLKELVSLSGYKQTTLERRLYDYGWSVNEAMETPVRKRIKN